MISGQFKPIEQMSTAIMNTPLHRRHFLRAAALTGVGGSVALLGHAQDSPKVGADLVTSDAQTAIDRGLEYLAAHQGVDGAFTDKNGGANVAVTALAGLALLAGGHLPGRGKYGQTVARAADYLLMKGASGTKVGYLQNTEGFLAHGAMYQHGFGSLFLAEMHGTFPDPEKGAKVRDMLEKAIALIVKAQNREGGWRYTPEPTDSDVSVTVAQLMALRAAKNAGIFVDKAVVDKCVEYIRACKLPDGSFMYQKGKHATSSPFPRSAAAIVGLYSAGIYEGEIIERGLKYLMRYLPTGGRNGNDVRPDHFFYGHYYAALAMWTAGGTYWNEWFPAIRKELLARRGASQVWEENYNGTAYGTAMACIILQLPNNYLPIMQK